MIVIRPGRDGETATLAAIFTRAVHEIASRDYDAAQLRAWAPGDVAGFAARHRAYDAIVAEYDGVIAGFSDLKSDGYIDMLYVSPDFQRRGVARALLNHIEAQARNMRMARLHVRASITARPVFARHAFQVMEPLTVELAGQSFQTYVMEKRL
ncbi:MAG TPA: GNAT family N-acetyltransferase [Rhizomicrobium sp.]